ncbi:MAG: carboxymuconolactone decarboxylase family protein [Gemmatimonadota bacterium]|nr:MAG: carboxymuconolactone decarboxylase family protein [Gemmatimonadota bacterium]
MSIQKKRLTRLYESIVGDIDESHFERLWETFCRAGLDLRKRLLCAISTLVTMGKSRHLEFFIEWALSENVVPVEINEVILQSYLFAGYPAAIEGLFVLRKVLQKSGMSFEASDVGYDVRGWRERGLKLCRQVYGKNFNRLQENMAELSPELAEWMIVEGYGKVLDRPQLGTVERELCTVASLTAMGWERQLLSHIKGALNVGAPEDEVREAICQTALFAGDPASQNGLELLNHC